jgi:hypothetical protein
MSLSILVELGDVGYLLKHKTGSQRYLSFIMQCRRSEVWKSSCPHKLVEAVRAFRRRSETETTTFEKRRKLLRKMPHGMKQPDASEVLMSYVYHHEDGPLAPPGLP